LPALALSAGSFTDTHYNDLTVESSAITKSVREHVPQILFALLHSGLGDLDRAFQSLERCYGGRDGHLFYLSVLPGFDPLRSDPRYDDLLRRLGVQ